MKTIYKGKDDLYYVINLQTEDGTILTPSDIDALKIEFFTSGNAKKVFNKEDISTESVLFVNAADLADLPDGPLKARFHISISDPNFSDLKYDQTADRLTGYFIKTLPATE